MTSGLTVETMFLLPDCDAHVPAEGTGGRNFGVVLTRNS